MDERWLTLFITNKKIEGDLFAMAEEKEVKKAEPVKVEKIDDVEVTLLVFLNTSIIYKFIEHK